MLTLVEGGPGPVRYQTEDGSCGEVIFTEAGSISIIDDDGDGDDGAGQQPAATTSSTTTIRQPAPAVAAPTRSSSASASGPIATVPPVVSAPSTPTTSPSSDLAVELASGKLRAAPGFELTFDEGRPPTPGRTDAEGGSAWPSALGLGTAAVVGGGAVWMRRRSRWSPTRT